MKFIVALAALCVVVVLASAAPNPSPFYGYPGGYGGWGYAPSYYGGVLGGQSSSSSAAAAAAAAASSGSSGSSHLHSGGYHGYPLGGGVWGGY